MCVYAAEYQRNLKDVDESSSQELRALERRLSLLKEGAQTEKSLLTSALDGANHMRRVQVRMQGHRRLRAPTEMGAESSLITRL